MYEVSGFMGDTSVEIVKQESSLHTSSSVLYGGPCILGILRSRRVNF